VRAGAFELVNESFACVVAGHDVSIGVTCPRDMEGIKELSIYRYTLQRR